MAKKEFSRKEILKLLRSEGNLVAMAYSQAAAKVKRHIEYSVAILTEGTDDEYFLDLRPYKDITVGEIDLYNGEVLSLQAISIKGGEMTLVGVTNYKEFDGNLGKDYKLYNHFSQDGLWQVATALNTLFYELECREED